MQVETIKLKINGISIIPFLTELPPSKVAICSNSVKNLNSVMG
jgi:hypothetical protein